MAKRNAEALGVQSKKIHVLPNVIDLADFDVQATHEATQFARMDTPKVVAVGRLVPEKRLDRYLGVLALARQKVPDLKGFLIGDGPERQRLESIANDLGLLPEGLQFFARWNGVPALLSHVQMLILCSDHEGLPNVLLEAMAARLPVITTAAGDAADVVQDGITGYVVPFDDIEGMAERMICLARSPDLRRKLGEAGRRRVELLYSSEGLANRLLCTYRSIAERQHDGYMIDLLSP
jgi:glycosyltransferase involved in cell wall biosynthesis